MKIIVLFIVFVTTVIIGLLTLKYFSIPNLDKIEERTRGWQQISEVSYPDNYKKLVSRDAKNENSFLINEVVYSAVYQNSFPYTSNHLDFEKTQNIIRILNDSGSYVWGELGTPEYHKTIIYYGKTAEPIGYTLFDLDGEVENYPYRSLMKWGALTEKAYNKLSAELNTQ